MRLEQSRVKQCWLPWRPDYNVGEVEDDCEDVDRIVALDDLQNCLYDVKFPRGKHNSGGLSFRKNVYVSTKFLIYPKDPIKINTSTLLDMNYINTITNSMVQKSTAYMWLDRCCSTQHKLYSLLLPPAMGARFYRFLGRPVKWTCWLDGTAAIKSGSQTPTYIKLADVPT